LFHFRLMEEQLQRDQSDAAAHGARLYIVQARYRGGCRDYDGLNRAMHHRGWRRLVDITQAFVTRIRDDENVAEVRQMAVNIFNEYVNQGDGAVCNVLFTQVIDWNEVEPFLDEASRLQLYGEQ